MSVAFRVALLSEVHGPFIFLDELAYSRIAQSVAHGHLALFDVHGVTFAPLYSAVLAPIYALGASGAAAYGWIKLVNAVLMSLSVFPIYAIARFVLAKRDALLAAVLLAVAPLMYYTALGMSENLAYPLFLLSTWTLLASLRSPGPRTDALLLLSIGCACLARIQFVVLVPVAFTAFVLDSVPRAKALRVPVLGVVWRSFRRRWLFVDGIAIVAAGSLSWAATRGGAQAVIGRYADVPHAGLPNPWHVLVLAVQHLAELDLAAGVIPFVGALVATYALCRFGAGPGGVAFGSVAVALTVWLLIETAYDVATFNPTENLPTLYERYAFYLIPLFVIALIAAARLPSSSAPLRVYAVAVVVAATLPATIPYARFVNNTIVEHAFGLEPFARQGAGPIAAIPHATRAAVLTAAALGLIALAARNRLPALAVALLIVSLFGTALARNRIVGAASGSTGATLPAHRDWVDRAKPAGDVILIAGQDVRRGQGVSRLAVLETAYYNLTIKRLYYVCEPAAEPDFGEDKLSVGAKGAVRDAAGQLTAQYAVVSTRFRIRGKILARNGRGSQLLVAPEDGVVTLRDAHAFTCRRPTR
jgi:hypothetical protein